VAISSIPTTRLSQPFVTQRILSQITTDQRNLFRVQTQLSSGRRFAAPSDDAASAMRALSLQSLLERKQSVNESLGTNETYLSSSESAIGTVATQLSDMRALALSVAGTNVSQEERNAALVEIERTIDQLVNIGNQAFRGRYLFAGSKTLVAPYQKAAGGIAYYGNETDLQAFSDVDALFTANISGNSVFGGFSQAVQGTADLNPVLTADTRLSDLRGGRGIRVGSIIVSDGLQTSTISIKGAETIGDVARLLEAFPPGNRTVTARVTSRGLEVSLDGGTLSIEEVGGGSTAAELGIRLPNGSGPGPIVGDDLDARVTLGTKLADILGSRARAYLPADGKSNDLIIEAASSGTQYNGVQVKYVDDDWFQPTPGLTAGNEFAAYHPTATPASAVLKYPGRPGLDNGVELTATTAGAAFNNVQAALNVRAVDGLGTQLTYNPTTKGYLISVETGTTVGQMVTDIQASGGPFTAALTSLGNAAYVLTATDSNPAVANTHLTGNDANTLAIHIDFGQSTANQVIAALAAEGTFTGRLDPSEEKSTGNGPLVDSETDPTAVGVTSGGSGENLDLAHGLRIVNAGVTYDIDVSKAKTVEDLINTLNGSGAQVFAAVNASGRGIDIRSRLSGATFSIGELGGTTATQLGVRSLTANTALSALNDGDGVRIALSGDDFSITRRDGTAVGVRLAGGQASARIGGGAGANSGLLINSVATGTDGNNYRVQLLDSGPGNGDSVTLSGNTLQFNVDVAAGFTAQEAIDLLAAHPTLAAQFTAQLDRSVDTANNGSGNLAVLSPVSFSGGQNSAQTIQDVLNLVNNDPTNLASGPKVVARLATTGNGIELVNDGPPDAGTLTVTQLGTSTAARDLGLVPGDSAVSGMPTPGIRASTTFAFAGGNNNLTISAAATGSLLNGVTVHWANDGVAGNNSATYNAGTGILTIDVDPATTTAQNIVDLLSGDPRFRASLTPNDNGVVNTGLGTLGALPADQSLAGGTADVLTGRDTNGRKVEGIFSALIELRAAVASGSTIELSKAVDALDGASLNLSFSRAELGARLKSIDALKNRNDAEDVTLRGALSDEIDVDFAAAVSEFAARQASLEAALQVSAQIARATLLDYI
jgi:flagellin-like hook-associated protein FlgL